jgi:hypothetical protein
MFSPCVLAELLVDPGAAPHEHTIFWWTFNNFFAGRSKYFASGLWMGDGDDLFHR